MATQYHQPDTTTSAYGPSATHDSHVSELNGASPAVSAEDGDISSRPVSRVESLSPIDSVGDDSSKLIVVTTDEPEQLQRQPNEHIASPLASSASHDINHKSSNINHLHSGTAMATKSTKASPTKQSDATTAAHLAATAGPTAPHQHPKRPVNRPQRAFEHDNRSFMSKLCCCFSSFEPEYGMHEQVSRPQGVAAGTAAYEPKSMQTRVGSRPGHKDTSTEGAAAAAEAKHTSTSTGPTIAETAAVLAAGAAAGTVAVDNGAVSSDHTINQDDELKQHHQNASPLTQEVDHKDMGDDSSAYELSEVVHGGENSEFSSDPRYFAPSQGWLLKPVSEQLAGRKCLVLDLDETLVHSSFKYIHQADFVIPVEIEGQYHNVYVIKRPGVDEFMKRMGELYEVVVFTASVSKYGDPLLDQLDIHNVVHHRLFRESCYNHQGNYIKNLSQLGRPLKDVIIIDNSPASYIFHPQHAIPVSSWFSDAHDNELLDMLDFLEDMAKPTVEDVSLVLDVNM